MKSIAQKLELLHISKDDPTLGKYIFLLKDISTEKITEVVNYLSPMGINLKPGQIRILYNSFDYIKSQINYANQNGEISKIIENPNLINDKRYGNVMANEVKDTYESPVVTEEVYDFANYFTESGFSEPINEPIFTESKNETLENLSSDEKMDMAFEEVDSIALDPYEEILSKPQNCALTDETFDLYQKISDTTGRILYSIYQMEEIPEVITDNLVKLIASGVTDEKIIIKYAITFGKNLTAIEKERINEAINNELEYTSLLDVDLGRAV